MRRTFARLAGLAAATSLMLTPLAVTPSEAASPGYGTLTVNIADDLGHPVTGYAIAVSGTGAMVPLGPTGTGASSFTKDVPAGSYGVVVFGGWSGISCLGLASCSFLSMLGGGTVPSVTIPAAVVADQGSQTVNVVTETPKLIGSGKVGSPLELAVPTSLTEFSSLYGGGYYGGFSTLPGVSWQTDGAPIPGAANALTYTPDGGLNGKAVTAVVTYPSIVSYFIQSYYDFDGTPPPFTTNAMTISKNTPSISLVLPRAARQGALPKALVKLNFAGKAIAGLVQLKIKGKRTVNGLVRAGFADIKLPALKPGVYKVTAAYGGSDLYAPVSATKTIKVKPKKKPKK